MSCHPASVDALADAAIHLDRASAAIAANLPGRVRVECLIAADLLRSAGRDNLAAQADRCAWESVTLCDRAALGLPAPVRLPEVPAWAPPRCWATYPNELDMGGWWHTPRCTRLAGHHGDHEDLSMDHLGQVFIWAPVPVLFDGDRG